MRRGKGKRRDVEFEKCEENYANRGWLALRKKNCTRVNGVFLNPNVNDTIKMHGENYKYRLVLKK